MNAPATDEWKRLYDAADAFRKQACWTWMYDSDLVAVHDPETGEAAYCSVMGGAGQFFGLGVYRGPEGFHALEAMFDDPAACDPMRAMFEINCLVASFGDRGELDKSDLETIRAVGRRYRGRNAWPQFRSYRPGYAPWLLEAAEARLLAAALEQFADVAARYRNEPELLEPPDDDNEAILTRVPVKHKGGLAWEDRWICPESLPQPAPQPAPIIDLKRLREIERLARPCQGAWELALTLLPTAVAEGERPYYPYGLLCVDRASGMVLGMQLAPPSQVPESLPDLILKTLEKIPAHPASIAFSNPLLRTTLEALAPSLGFRPKQQPSLPMADQALAAMSQFLLHGGMP
ncbi:MAG: hypothetical protein NTW86_26995 [Candidatus Sumerlaeota bacterium]|nr:hypothetical protein [Candidatus Sumerlaeota bacterium]